MPARKPIEPARIVLIEDHELLRDGLRALLDLEDDFTVVGVASADAGLAMLAELKPDVVVTELNLCGGSRAPTIPNLKLASPESRVLILTGQCTDEQLRAALDAGVDGYVLKDATRDELMEGIRTLRRGRQFFSEAVESKVVSGYLKARRRPEPERPHLTAREKEVLRLIALANSTKHIANRLNLSVKTVEKHRSNLMRKLELRNIAAVTLYAIRHRLVPIDIEESTHELGAK